MKSYFLITVIVGMSLWTTSSKVSNVDTCMDENSNHTYRMLKSFLNNSSYEPDHIEGGILNLSMDDIILLTSLEHSGLCEQIKQTSLYINTPSSRPTDISFFMSSNRRFIVYFFLDSLPSDDGLTFNTGAMGIIVILDENMEHIKSVLFW